MNKKTSIAVVIAVFIVLALFGGRQFLINMFSAEETNINANMENTTKQVQIKDTEVGAGVVAKAGKMVTVHYTGVFSDGKKFDSSRDRGTPFTFKLGAGQVIKGWDIGVEGMKVGGKRILVIPPELGYGANDYGPIPGNSTLIFEVELLKVE